MTEAEATAQLQTIRSLMERAAVYRRALGPTLLSVGGLGTLAMAVGVLASVSAAWFASFWLGVAILAVSVSLLMIRTQALRAAEPFWTPPARRVASAMLPPVVAAIAATTVLLIHLAGSPRALLWLPPVWLVCYGLAVHAAGFFTIRALRRLGWAYVLCGALAGLFAAAQPAWLESSRHAHLLMGVTFGLGHLAAGAWLLVVERKTPA
ncbi:MAG TPA: hypothetical protein PLX89_26050 [Verrucomicrobiota bacterium]|nr:hypothetical protein [Verrucomicrobiota bacterium]